MEGLDNELWRRWSFGKIGEWPLLCSFSNISDTSPTSQLILQPFSRITYVTAQSSTLPLLHLRHSSFSNPSFASPTSQSLHLRHLASRPCFVTCNRDIFTITTITEDQGSIPGSVRHSVLPKGRSFSETQHSPLCPPLSLVPYIFIPSIFHNIVNHLISASAANFLPVYHPF